MTPAPAPAPAPGTVPAPFRVDVKLDDRARVCRSMDELLAFLRDLSGGLGTLLVEHRARAVAIRDAKIRLGKALLQVRGQVQHGTWERVLSGLGINRKTADAAVRIAEKFADDRGVMDPAKVAEAQARKAAEPGMERIAAKPASDVSIRDLTALAAETRSATQTGPGNFGLRASHLPPSPAQAAGLAEWDVDDEDDELDGDAASEGEPARSEDAPEGLPGLSSAAAAGGGVHRADDAARDAARSATAGADSPHQLTFAGMYEAVAASRGSQDRLVLAIRSGRADLAAEFEQLEREHDERLRRLCARLEAA